MNRFSLRLAAVASGPLCLLSLVCFAPTGCSSTTPGLTLAEDASARKLGENSQRDRPTVDSRQRDASADAEGDSNTVVEGGAPEAAVPFDRNTGRSTTKDGEMLPSDRVPKTCSPACGVQAVCVAGTCEAARRVFVSSQSFSARLGGHNGADALCDSLAVASGVPGTYMAWLSDSKSSPLARFTKSTAPYRLLNGALVAPNWEHLVNGKLEHAIDLDERGQPVKPAEVWTATDENGVADNATCNDFSSTDAGSAPIGFTTAIDRGWTISARQTCDKRNLRLYCVEQ